MEQKWKQPGSGCCFIHHNQGHRISSSGDGRKRADHDELSIRTPVLPFEASEFASSKFFICIAHAEVTRFGLLPNEFQRNF